MFDRLLKLISKEDLEKINKVHVLLIGIGGVGGYALESMARIGIQNITIVDNDIVDLSNLNRQIISLHSNIGETKVEVAKKRVLDINPNINLNINNSFITKDNINSIITSDIDYIIDACDTVTTKVELIKIAQAKGIKIVSIMGTGNRLNPTMLEITDVYKTNYDPLAKVMRKLLRDNNIKKADVITSREMPIKTGSRTPGSTSLVPSVAGIYATYYIINDILKG